MLRPAHSALALTALIAALAVGGVAAVSASGDDPSAACDSTSSPTPGGVGLTVTCLVPTPAPVTETATETTTATATATATATVTATATTTVTATPSSTPTATPPPASVTYGANYTQPDDEAQYQGRADVARIYLGSGGLITDITTKAQYKRAYAAGVRTFVVSWKDNDPTKAGQMLDSFPDGTTVYGVFRHEPENDGTSAATWKSQQVAMMATVRQHGAIPTAILMSWTLNPSSGRNLADWVLPAGTIDVLGFDYYPDKQPTLTQSQVVAKMRAAESQFGVHSLLIGEYGVPSSSAIGVQLIAEFKGLIASGVVVACYWSDQVSATATDYHLTAQTAAAWFN